MKRILLIHNFYGSSSPSGENQVFENEKKLLSSRGHKVYCFTRNSDELRNAGVIGTIKGGLATPWNPFAQRELEKVLNEFKPDIVHIHNTFPLISPAIFPALSNIKTVITLHNYRYFCVNGIPMRDNKLCTECLDRGNAVPALVHGCYRKSRLATLPLAISVTQLRINKILQKYVDGYVAFSDFQKEKLAQQGLDRNKIFIKPNFNSIELDYDYYQSRVQTVLFVGRLSDEKGLLDLLTAWKKMRIQGYQLEIVGDGDNKGKYLDVVKEIKNIKFLGKLSVEETQAKISKSKLLVLPSVCYEGYPMVLSEAFAAGTPVAVSNMGPLPEIVKNVSGAVFRHADPENLGEVLSDVLKRPKTLQLMSERGRRYYLETLTPDKNYERLINIYESL